MKIYIVTWYYHSDDDGGVDDNGVCKKAFTDKKSAQEYLLEAAEDDFNTWCADEYEPEMMHEDDYAKVWFDGASYEYRVVSVELERSLRSLLV